MLNACGLCGAVSIWNLHPYLGDRLTSPVVRLPVSKYLMALSFVPPH
jgi:hypothetical protein